MGAWERVMVPTEGGRQLEVLVSGPAGGTAVVIHMGTPSGLVPLPSQLDISGKGFRAVLYGRPGYGASTPKPGRTSADAAADTAAILDALGIETFLNIGLSGGGPPSLACSALLPERCVATAVVAGLAPLSSGVWPEDAAPLSRQGAEVLSVALEEERVNAPKATAEDMPAVFSAPPDRACLTGELAEWLAEVYHAAFATGIAGPRDDNLANVAEWGFDVAHARNVSIWQGEQDENVPPIESIWLAEHIPGAELHLLPDVAHISILLHFQAIVDDLATRSIGKA